MLLTSRDLKGFLKDYEDNCEVSLLEDSKERNELIDIAKKRGILVKDSKDLGMVKLVYAFVDEPNDNGAILKKNEILRILPQLIGKPLDRDHVREQVRGFYVDYKYDPNYVTKDGKRKKAIITYSTFLKKIFESEWAEAKKLIKEGNLSHSFEIWSPKEARNYKTDGTYEMNKMEIAGGALLFNYDGDTIPPAYPDAHALALAKKYVTSDYLELSSKYKEDDILNADTITEVHIERIVKCENCQREFDYAKVPEAYMGAVKCPNCKAIIDQTGRKLYDAQVIDFNVSCLNPRCDAINQWLIETRTEEDATIKCLSCSHKYKIKFLKGKDYIFNFPISKAFEMISNYKFKCPQCGHSLRDNNVKEISSERITFKCNNCSLIFPASTQESRNRKISLIEPIKEEKNLQEKGGKGMLNLASGVYRNLALFYRKNLESFKISLKEREELKDTDFAYVKTVIKKIGESSKKIRLFPINNEDNTIDSCLLLSKTEKEVEALGIEVATIREKITKKLKEFNIDESKIRNSKNVLKTSEVENKDESSVIKAKLDKYSTGIKRLGDTIIKLKQSLKSKDVEISTVKAELEKKIEFYRANAQEIASVRLELGDFADELTDEDLLNVDKVENARLKKELAEQDEIDEQEQSPEESTKRRESKSPAQKAVDYFTWR